MSFSQYMHTMERNDVVAVFHGLKPVPIYIRKDVWDRYRNRITKDAELDSYLQGQGLIGNTAVTDASVLKEIRKGAGMRLMSILYLVLTKNCNFRCRQCFQHERHPELYPQKKGTPLMSRQVARLAIEAFARHLAESDDSVDEPQVQFYGGEPLLNWKTLSFSVGYIKKLQSQGRLPSDLRLIVVTNASLISDDTARYFAENDVAVGVSIDGPQPYNDEFRVTPKGRGTYELIRRGVKTLQDHKVPVTLSVTVNPNIVDRLPSIIRWAKDEMGADSVGFNPIGGISYSYTGSRLSEEEYDQLLAKGLIEAFRVGRDIGVYEDRLGRKAEDFINQIFKSADCGAVANQLVVYPSGDIGFCHASENYNVGSVFDSEFRIFGNPAIQKWHQALPINSPSCLKCPAISICGYGCFHNALETAGDVSKKDSQFCLHTKSVMDFLVWDLYEKARE